MYPDTASSDCSPQRRGPRYLHHMYNFVHFYAYGCSSARFSHAYTTCRAHGVYIRALSPVQSSLQRWGCWWHKKCLTHYLSLFHYVTKPGQTFSSHKYISTPSIWKGFANITHHRYLTMEKRQESQHIVQYHVQRLAASHARTFENVPDATHVPIFT